MAFLFALFFALLILTFARQAWLHGVLVQYWGILGLAAGIAAGYLFFQNSAILLERLAPEYYLPLIPNVITSSVIGLAVYFIVRGFIKSILCSLFGEDSILNGWTEGLRGAILSLLPSLITVLIIASGIRAGGTLLELKHLENICRPKVNFSTKKYPSWPVWATWRDSVESIPFLVNTLKPLDPISRVNERRVVDLLVASKKPELLTFLRSAPETATIFSSKGMQDALASDDIITLLAKFQHVTLIQHALIRQAAEDPGAAKALADLELQPLIDGFMLSPERQQRLKTETVVMNQSFPIQFP
ncbi:MAG: hypothetical protein QM496_00125 [Verrucomicrobiota bacterium]